MTTDQQKRIDSRVNTIIEAARNSVSGYNYDVESLTYLKSDELPDGYGDRVIAERWHGPIMDQVEKLLSKLGVETDWQESWVNCCDCYQYLEAQPTSYSWRPDWIRINGGIICSDCISGNKYGVVAEYQSDPNKALDADMVEKLGLTEDGWVKVEAEMEYGWHPWQTDNPHDVTEALGNIAHLFVIDGVGQFDVCFHFMVDKEQALIGYADITDDDIRKLVMVAIGLSVPDEEE